MGFHYCPVISKLIYAMVTCQSDISYPLIKLSQYSFNCFNPKHIIWQSKISFIILMQLEQMIFIAGVLNHTKQKSHTLLLELISSLSFIWSCSSPAYPPKIFAEKDLSLRCKKVNTLWREGTKKVRRTKAPRTRII